MRLGWVGAFVAAAAMTAATAAIGQSSNMTLPPSVVAGSAFSIATSGSGKAVLYIVGPGQAVRRDVEMGQPVSFAAGVLYNAGHYLVILAKDSTTDTEALDVVPAPNPETLGFLAQPSRLPVGVHNGISGAVYVFDAYHNLMTTPMTASLELSNSSGTVQSRSIPTLNGLAWAEIDSASKEGTVKFVARVGGISSTRIIDQVPGDPCAITISAQPENGKLLVQTAPVHDCSGNAIPDGTIVTFTETYNDMQSTVDVPLKQGVARVTMPAYKGSKISAASGVVAGNEIIWDGGR